eukprot:scaffold26115_cov132-Cylindrotheca_fusiformis.AAC.4
MSQKTNFSRMSVYGHQSCGQYDIQFNHGQKNLRTKTAHQPCPQQQQQQQQHDDTLYYKRQQARVFIDIGGVVNMHVPPKISFLRGRFLY